MFNLPLRVVSKSKLSVAASSFSFTDLTGVPAGTRHLVLIVNARNDTGQASVLLRFNNDSGANYNFQTIKGAGATASAARTTGGTSITCFDHPTTASTFGGGMIVIPHYANTANHKAVLTMGGDNEQSVMAHAGRWANTGAITRIDVLASANNFVANSIALLCAVDERYLVEESSLSADGTVTFSSIPQTPGDLVVVGYCRTDRVAESDTVITTINADITDANYAFQRLDGGGATASATAGVTRRLAVAPGDSATANAFGPFVMSISQHANGVKQPHYLSISGWHSAVGPDSILSCLSGRRTNIAAYTSLGFAPGSGGTNFKSGSLFSLYHVPKRLVAYKKLTADAASITHTVPAGYESLVETVFTRSDVVAAQDYVDFAFNNDITTANYDQQYLVGDGAVVTAAQLAAARNFVDVPAASAAANVFGGGVVLIPAYTETDRHKHVLSVSGPSDDYVVIKSSRWENTAAITEIDLTPNTGPNFEGN